MATTLKRRSSALQKGDEREQSLMRAAERLLHAGTFDRASVGELAAEAGVSRPAFYFYFASKQALLASVVDELLVDVAVGIENAMKDSGAAPVQRLAAAIEAAADTWWEHGTVMCTATQLALTVPEFNERMTEILAGVNELVVDMVMTHGSVPESRDAAATTELVGVLALMNERSFDDAVRAATTREDLRPVERRLLAVWVRAVGLPA